MKPVLVALAILLAGCAARKINKCPLGQVYLGGIATSDFIINSGCYSKGKADTLSRQFNKSMCEGTSWSIIEIGLEDCDTCIYFNEAENHIWSDSLGCQESHSWEVKRGCGSWESVTKELFDSLRLKSRK